VLFGQEALFFQFSI